MKHFFTFLFTFMILGISAQTISDFEDMSIPDSSYIKDSGEDHGFYDGNIFLPNNYTNTGTFDFWDGWVISNNVDVETASYTNEGSAIVGSGYDGSSNYAVSYAPFPTKIILEGDAVGGSVNGLYITNNTYAALSMLNGDSFAKIFGGETGNDPDYFLLTIRKWDNGVLAPDSINFYLADYRFDNNDDDYIITDWTWVDLTDLGAVDSLQFSLSSTDNGGFGMNTPSYFCIDNLVTADILLATTDVNITNIDVFPNPATENITLGSEISGTYRIINTMGQLVQKGKINNNSIAINNLNNGNYTLQVTDGAQRMVSRFVKF